MVYASCSSQLSRTYADSLRSRYVMPTVQGDALLVLTPFPCLRFCVVTCRLWRTCWKFVPCQRLSSRAQASSKARSEPKPEPAFVAFAIGPQSSPMHSWPYTRTPTELAHPLPSPVLRPLLPSGLGLGHSSCPCPLLVHERATSVRHSFTTRLQRQ